jgi:hypothetical protein
MMLHGKTYGRNNLSAAALADDNFIVAVATTLPPLKHRETVM